MEIGNDFLQAAIEHSGKPLRTGGNTFYMRDGKLCIQASRRPASSGKNWVQTPARERCNRHFAAMRAVATYLKGVYEGLPVWQLAKKRQGWRMTVENFLMRVMRPYFDERGEMVRCEGALMSVGELVPPRGLAGEYAEGKLSLRWEAGEDAPGASRTDRLEVVYVRESRRGHVGRAQLEGAVRGDGEAAFALELAPGDRLHVFPFFAAADLSDFSRNGYLCVEGPAVP